MVRVALPLLFAVICLAESYLWRSNTGLMFVAFSSILYSDNVEINVEFRKEIV
jgi:O-antigen ligase